MSPGSTSATGSSPVSPSGPVRKRGGIKRLLEVFVIGWLITLGNVFLLLTSVLQIGTLQLDAAMAASPLPQPLPYVLLFGGAIVNTICGIGILYGEQLARIGSCALGIVGLIVAGGHLCPACASGLPIPAFPGQAVR